MNKSFCETRITSLEWNTTFNPYNTQLFSLFFYNWGNRSMERFTNFLIVTGTVNNLFQISIQPDPQSKPYAFT